MENKNINSEYRDNIMHKSDLLKAIASPVRLCILNKLSETEEMSVTDMQACIEASQSAISQHVRKLKDLGIVSLRKEGTSSYYSLQDDMVRQIVKIAIDW